MEAVVDLVAAVLAEQLVAQQLVPERLVPLDQLGGRLLRVELALAIELRLDVRELAGEVLLGDLEVVRPLAVREAGMELPVSASTR